MPKHFSVYDGEGMFHSQFHCKLSTLLLNLQGSDSYLEGSWDGNEYYALNGEATARPDLGLPTTNTLSVNTEWNLGSIPEGTDVLIGGVVVGTVGSEDLVLEFEFPETYQLRLEPPFPHKPADCEVTVT